MKLSPISKMNGITAVKPKLASEIPAAIAVERSGRMRDDAYACGQESGRGREEENSDPMEDDNSETEAPSQLPQSAARSAVNLVA